jgi:hypothetical protein
MPDKQKIVLDKLTSQFDGLYPLIQEMAETLGSIEPGGTLIDEVVIQSDKHGSAFVAYTADPLGIAFERGNKKYILKVLDV